MMQLNTAKIHLPHLGSVLLWIAAAAGVVLVDNGMQFIIDHRVTFQSLGVPLISIFSGFQVRVAGIRGFVAECLALVFALLRCCMHLT